MTTEHDHIVKAFDEDLKHVDTVIAEMGGLVEAQLAAAIEAMVQRDAEKAEKIISKDESVDALEKNLDRSIIKLLALRQPMAEDLRVLIAALKIGSAIERIGDYARNIAKRTLTLAQVPAIGPANTVARLGQHVIGMLKSVLDAYLKRDAEKAEDVRRSDREIDAMYTSLFRELSTYMMEDTRNITSCTHLMFAAKNIERVGDHIATIAECVIYLVRGHLPENRRPSDGPDVIPAMSSGLRH
jgi:phosphate transport system protein